MVSIKSREQATVAVNNVLSLVLPGSTKLDASNQKLRKDKTSKGSTAQLINQNLKKAVRVRERDAHGIKKRDLKARKKQIKAKQILNDQMDQKAKLDILQMHREQGTLTHKERKFLNKVISKNVRDLKSWDLQDEDLQELQDTVLINQSNNGTQNKRRSRKDFRENVSSSTGAADHRYPGLTPGLAPVGASDEEESDEE
ncbi:LANO_0H07800g1_1 [Lachancea nothofagi CBS 11611]|uniref:Regulator of rDNA transcription 14 n=1 Tax=Lachancea nothofagi CBS 11611 TaxID=1266666 RepID=A0A1G4KLJ7_9SACH|nr:LANO_0H07800g1_1 [Lachancea nothofagi CBS 11611]